MPTKQKSTELHEEKQPWWQQLTTRGGKNGKAVISKCCNVPISCPRCGYDYVCEWRCTKCHKLTDKNGYSKPETINAID